VDWALSSDGVALRSRTGFQLTAKKGGERFRPKCCAQHLHVWVGSDIHHLCDKPTSIFERSFHRLPPDVPAREGFQIHSMDLTRVRRA
jgi:hypothetical protein